MVNLKSNKSAETSYKGAVLRLSIIKIWRLWAKSLGEKSGVNDKEANIIAAIRSVIVLVNFITCFFIVAGVIHNW